MGSSVLLFRSLLSIYIFAFIDIGSDLWLTISLMNNDCLYEAYEVTGKTGEYWAIVVFLFFSCAFALLNTIVFKILYALRIKFKHKISFWNSVKYVATYTQLKTAFSHSKCKNKFVLLRFMIILTEDVIQVCIAIALANVLRSWEWPMYFSMYTSLIAIGWVVGTTLFWGCRDCCCYSWAKKHRKCCGYSKLCCGCLSLLLAFYISWYIIETGTELKNDGYTIADIDMKINWIDMQFDDDYIVEAKPKEDDFVIYNRAFTIHHGIRSRRDGIEQCYDSDGRAFERYHYAAYPAVCIYVASRRVHIELLASDDWTYNDVVLKQRVPMPLVSNEEYNVVTEDFFLSMCDVGAYRHCERPDFDVVWSNISLSIDYMWTYILSCDG